ncbi:helix-turn-helix domain-containing protein [Proteus hauseri]|uniref:helix-turn-helix domain-containing protein n=1 Tax=Proteus hauseri TaxID=183417 RepID=UPI0032DAB389
MIIIDAIQAANSLVNIVPILGGSHSRKDYEDGVKLVEYLVEHSPDNPLIDMLCTKIDEYENSAPEFQAFNEKLNKCDDAIAVLRTLMDQYNLNTTDFEDELGSRSYVSRILNGERNLTLEHIKKLAFRFNLPASLFIK